MTTDLVVIGAGGHGRELWSVLRDVNRAAPTWNLLGMVDDGDVDTARLERVGATVLGKLGWLDARPVAYALGIGAPAARRSIVDRFGAHIAATVVAPGASIGLDVELGDGVVIFERSTVTTNVRIGPHTHPPEPTDPGGSGGAGRRGGSDGPDGPYVGEPPVATRGTTHVTVADAEGNVAAMTTSNGECSGDVIDGTGILCNNMLGEDDLHPDGFHAAPPGVRVASMMSPTFVLGPDGTLELALGSGGSKRIRSAVLQVLTAVVDHGVDLITAVEAPRLHWDTDHTEVEPGFDADVLAALGAAGPVNEWPGPSVYFGGVHAVRPGVDAAGDPRRGGTTRTT